MTSSSTASLSDYRYLPKAVGWWYLVATSLGRLPLAMVPLAMLTLTTAATGSIALGGLASAAAAIGEAIGAPLCGVLSDKYGQRVVMLTGVIIHTVALTGFTVSAGNAPDAITIALAGLSGLTLPQVGALSRVRWLAIAPQHITTAFAFEGVIDELVYIFGPTLVGLVAVVVNPQAAVLLAGALIVFFVTSFAVHPTHKAVPVKGRSTDGAVAVATLPETGASAATTPHTRPNDGEVSIASDRAEHQREPGVRSPRLLLALTVSGTLAMGTFFGASQTALTAFAEQQGIANAGALLYAVMAVGSAAATIAMVLVPERIGTGTRWIVAAAGLTLGSACMLVAPNLPLLVAAAVLAGVFQGPLLLTMFAVAGSLSQEGHGGIAMTALTSGTVLGIAIGSSIAGILAQLAGAVGGFSVVLAASFVMLLVGLAVSRATRPVVA